MADDEGRREGDRSALTSPDKRGASRGQEKRGKSRDDAALRRTGSRGARVAATAVRGGRFAAPGPFTQCSRFVGIAGRLRGSLEGPRSVPYATRLTPSRDAALLNSLLLALALAPQGGGAPTNVRVDPVRVAELQERRTVQGDVKAVRRTAVASEEAGSLVAVEVDEGERVESGQVLARLDATRLELEREVLVAQAAVAAALVVERERRLELEERDLAAVRTLAERKAANAKEVADAETRVAEATARLEQAKSEETVLSARTRLIDDRLADRIVRAPFAGTIVRVDVELGEWVEVGASVAELVSADVEVWLEVPQRYLSALGDGSRPLPIRIAEAESTVDAERWRLVPVVDPTARMLTVIGSLPQGTPAVPGMSATARVPISDTAKRPTVAIDALLRNELGPYLFVAVPGPEGQPWSARPVQVDVLWREGGRAVVAGPLKEGDAAIVEGQQRLFPMAPVVPVSPGKEGGGPKSADEAASGS